MNVYHFFLYLHIIGAIIWLGSGLSLASLGIRAASLSAADRFNVVKVNEWFGQKIFSWAGMLTLIAGFGLVGIGSRTEIVDVWVIVSLLLIAASMIVLTTMLRPVQKKILEHDPKVPQFERLYIRYLHISYFDVLLLLFVVFLMVSKPDNLVSASFLISMAIFLIASLGVFVSHRRQLQANSK